MGSDMRCTKCHREMRPLFISFVCDYCDGLREEEYDTGWVAMRDARPIPSLEYVFRSPEDATRWIDLRGWENAEVRKVRTRAIFRWRTSRGTIRDLILADRLFEIHAQDAPGGPEENHAFLV